MFFKPYKEEMVMSTEENKAHTHQYFEEMNKGNLVVIDELCTPEFVYHGTTGDMTREQFKQYAMGLLTAFPDLSLSIDDMIAEGDKVAVRYTFQGTHRGVFRGIAPTGKQITFSGLEIDRCVGGKFVETWLVSDTLGMMQQLGAIPSG
jgi:predicted ester cyclase